jgi:LacI family transcriptional regulator
MPARSRVTSRDVAAEVGVSQSTVSRALQGDPRVAPETVERIRAAVERLGYIPNQAARSLITRRSDTIAVVAGELTNPFYPEIVQALGDELALAGYRMELLSTRADGGREHDVLEHLGRSAIDGVVLAAETTGSGTAAALARRGVPVVLLNRDVDGVEVDRVVSDNRHGGALAARALLELGHRRIGLIAGPPTTSTGRDRAEGFRGALRDAGAPLDERYARVTGFSHEGGYQFCGELLALPEPPTAILCGNDVIAFGAFDAARGRGVAVPKQLSVLGYDDIEMAGWEAFGLTTVRQPLARMARAAAELLLERIAAPALEPRRRIFPPDLVRRETTAPPA